MSDADGLNGPIELTREELYRQVWKVPISELAAQYGIAGKELAKICDRLKIRYPTRWYWSNKSAGKSVVKYRLLPPDDDTPQTVTITPRPPAATIPKLTSERRVNAEAIGDPATPASVTERLVRPHAIIAGWLDEHGRRRREYSLSDSLGRRIISSPELSGLERRRFRILDALLKELERQGGRAKGGERRALYVEMAGEPIEFQLREKLKQVKRPLTAEEKRYSFIPNRGWKQELQPTGKLVLAIKTYLPPGLRAEWLETDEKSLESLLPQIVATFISAGPKLAEQRRQREEERRQWELAEQQRREDQQRRKLDDNRWRRFVELAHQWRAAETARQFIDALKDAGIDPDQHIGDTRAADWIAWAEDRLLKMDPLERGTTDVFRMVAKTTAWTYHD
jgi:hypothetical protein